MRIPGITLLALLAAAPLLRADETVDDASTVSVKGLVVAVPDGWRRDVKQERGDVVFASMLDVAAKKYVLFRVQAASAQDFDAGEWIGAEKQRFEKLIPGGSFEQIKDVRTGGAPAAGFVTSGTVTEADATYELRVKGRGVVSGDTFYRVLELSYNGAHEGAEESVDAMWDGISFQGDSVQDEADGAEAGGGDAPADPAPASDGAIEFKDVKGNFKVKLAKGWEILYEAGENDSAHRASIVRKNAQDAGVVLLEIFRLESSNAGLFITQTADSVLTDILDRENQFFEPWYGEGTAGTAQPRIDAGVGFGGADKTTAYEYRALTREDTEKKIKAEEEIRRGVEGAKMPDVKELVVRGRVGLVSPYIYIVRARFAPEVADDEALLAEFNQLLDSYELLQGEALPPAIPGIETTVGDPKFADEREGTFLFTEPGRKPYKLEATFDLPPGFQKLDGGQLVFVLQDKKNNWVKIGFSANNHGAAGERNMQLVDKKQVFEQFRTEWTSKARGSEMKEKPGKVRVGRFSGDGYKFEEGIVDGFRGTYTAILKKEGQWRLIMVMETCGNAHQLYEEQIEDLFKSMKFKRIK